MLNTHSGTLKFFTGPGDVYTNHERGYAILSHVWGDSSQEDTFQKVQAAAKQCEQAKEAASSSVLGEHRAAIERLHNIVEEQQRSILELRQMVSSLAPEPRKGPVVSRLRTTLRAATRFARRKPTASREVDAQAVGPPSDAQDNTPLKTPIPRDLLSPKVRGFLEQAEKDGYDWAWADTCCIDKTSSAELSEGINSMFEYYAQSSVCYVYLVGVSPGPVDQDPKYDLRDDEFEGHRWHTRGWTLQELLAPKDVRFMSDNWTYIGNKFNLARRLERCTNIPESVLRFEKEITEMCIAERMGWASERKTTRVEDEAYCLFGLFGINMPTLYGEGRNAFYRLQEEILRTSVDTTLFAHSATRSVESEEELDEHFRKHVLPWSSTHLFASGPKYFRRMRERWYNPPGMEMVLALDAVSLFS